jgi:chitinase domain-containing protein 1
MILALLAYLFTLASSYTITVDSILTKYNTCNNCDHKISNVETLAYVTPWNEDGYEAAIKYWHKFNYIAPAWYEIHIQNDINNTLNLTISGNANRLFLENLKDYDVKSIITPQFEIREPFDNKAYRSFLVNDTNVSALGDAIYDRLSLYNFTYCIVNILKNGSKILKQNMSDYPEYRRLQILVVDRIVKYLILKRIRTLIVIPKVDYSESPDFKTDDLLLLFRNVHRFIIITNDFSDDSPGPNSPIRWVRRNINNVISGLPDNTTVEEYREYKKKLMFCIPLFAWEFVPTSQASKGYESRALKGPELIEILRTKQPKLTWEENHGELRLEYKNDTVELTTYYNSQESIIEKIKLASRLGTGVMLWELGQGLPFDYEPI